MTDQDDDDLLGLGASKPREEALRRKWARGSGGDPASRSSRDELRILYKLSAIGFQFIGEVGASILIGYLIDLWRGTLPFWTTIFSVGGIILGLVTLVRSGWRMNRLLDQSKPTRPSAPTGLDSQAEVSTRRDAQPRRDDEDERP